MPGFRITLFLAILISQTIVAGADDSPISGHSTLVVAQDGSGQYRSIQSAIDAAKKGDIIKIQPGTYHEDVKIHNKEHLKLIGAGIDQVTLLGSDVVGVLYIGKLPYGAADIEISGMTINERGGQAVGIFLGRRILLRQIRVNGMLFGQQAEGVRIEDSMLGGSETTGVHFVDSQAELVGNFIHDNDHGVNAVGASDIRLERNVLTRNLFEAVVVGGRSKAELVSNTLVKNGGGAAFLDTAQVQARGNIVNLNAVGFAVAPSSLLTLAHNVMKNSGGNYVRPGSPAQPAPELNSDSDLAVDADFIDMNGDDFRLRSDTPLVKIGGFPFLGALPPLSRSR